MKKASFLFHVGPQYFPGHKVTQPVYIEVQYSYGLYSCDVTNITLGIAIAPKIKISTAFIEDISAAAMQHYEKSKDPDDLKYVNI